VGALYKRRSLKINPISFGGGQENGLSPGTYDTPNIVGLGKACEIASTEYSENYQYVAELNEFFIKEIQKISINKINGNIEKKSPYIVNVYFDDYEAQKFILQFRDKFSVSTGSACNNEIVSPSHVLLAMGLNNERANKSIRFSFGKQTKKEELKKILELLK
jgi:cysteine desulfurase